MTGPTLNEAYKQSEAYWDFDPHPEYGPCDGFAHGSCSECKRVIYNFHLAAKDAMEESTPLAKPINREEIDRMIRVVEKYGYALKLSRLRVWLTAIRDQWPPSDTNDR